MMRRYIERTKTIFPVIESGIKEIPSDKMIDYLVLYSVSAITVGPLS